MAASMPSPPLVGRERELATLRTRLDAALAGQGGLVLIGGEAGIGKTALADALCREAAASGVLVRVGRCYDLTETPPYGPWLEIFGRYRQDDGMPPLPDAFAQRGTVGEVASQAALFRQVLDFFAALTETRTLVMLVDDLHWADPASLDLLRFLARSAAMRSLLIIATYRTDELTRRHPLYALLPTLAREAPTARIDLNRLERADIVALITARYALSNADTDRLVTHLHARSGGNPFFLGELLRTLEAERILRHAAGGAVGDWSNVRVPMLLRQVIDGRLGRLDEDSQRLLTIAAVLGQEVPLRVWSAVSDADDDTLAATVERAIEAHLLDTFADGTAVRFVHALIREALYERAVPIRRDAWHRRAAELLASAPRPDPDAVAYHYRRAGDPQAATWLVRAGERAEVSHALLSAADRYDAALALMEAGGAGASERGWLLYRLAHMRRFGDNTRALAHLDAAADLAAEAGDRALAAYIMRSEGLYRCLTGDLRAGLPRLQAGVAAVESLLTATTLREPEEGPGGASWSEYATNWSIHTLWLANTGQFAAVHAAWERAIDGVGQLPPGGVEGLPGNPHWGRALAFAQQGRVVEARQAFAHARRYFRADEASYNTGGLLLRELIDIALPYHADDVAGRRRLVEAAERAWTRAGVAQATIPAIYARLPLLALEGDWDELRRIIRGAPTTRGAFAGQTTYASYTIGAFGYVPDDPDTGWPLVHTWLPDGPETEPGAAFYFPTMQLQRLATALAYQAGDLATMRRWLEAQDRWLAWSGAVLGRAERCLGWARYHRSSGDPSRACRDAIQGLADAGEPRQPLALLAAHRLLGELDTDAGRLDDAVGHLDSALALADACAAPYERALGLLAFARLRSATGDREVARALLDEVRAICAPLAAKPALARADALTARLAAMPPPAPVFPDGLSAREVDVLRLIACGSTNQEIAATLSLSVRTVERHITGLYRKIDGRGRADATTYALRHALAPDRPSSP